MIDFYLGCLVTGVILTLISALFGDILDGVLDGGMDFLHHDFFKPIVVVSGLTAFGGSGYLLERYFDYSTIVVIIFSVILAVLIGIFIVFAYIKPTKNSENSVAYKTSDLEGKLAEVISTIPSKGYGEVIVKVGAGIANYPAVSYDKVEIKSGEKVIVIDIVDHALYVAKSNL